MTDSLPPHIVGRILSEIREIVKHPIDGVSYLEEDNNSVNTVHALIQGPEGTPFVGGKFRMKLVLSNEYPSVPPRGYFLTRIYHPNVSPNGDICVNTLKKDWTPDVTLKHVLQVIRCLLIVPFPESSLNDEAGKLFMESYDEFARRARIMTQVHAIDSTDENESGATTVDSQTNEQNRKAKDIQTAKKKSLKRL